MKKRRETIVETIGKANDFIVIINGNMLGLVNGKFVAMPVYVGEVTDYIKARHDHPDISKDDKIRMIIQLSLLGISDANLCTILGISHQIYRKRYAEIFDIEA